MIADVLKRTAHRPWPLPDGPWVMAQEWHDLLFAHWPMPVEMLRPLVPAPLVLDTFEARAWLGIVPFRITGMRPRLVPPLPLFSRFPELNVRTYVRSSHPGSPKPGVYFFSLDAANPLSASLARLAFRLKYHWAKMKVRRENGRVSYSSRRIRGDAAFEAEYAPKGEVFQASPGSLEHWLTERYSVYTVHRGSAFICEIHHPPWELQTATAEIIRNGMTAPLCLKLAGEPLLHFAAFQEVATWALRKIES